MNDTSIVKMLVDAGADLDNQDSDGKSPLHYAVYKNQPHDMVAYLLEVGANARIADEDGMTVLQHAVFKAPSLVRLLIPNSDLNARDSEQKTVLHHVSYGDALEVVE